MPASQVAGLWRKCMSADRPLSPWFYPVVLHCRGSYILVASLNRHLLQNWSQVLLQRFVRLKSSNFAANLPSGVLDNSTPCARSICCRQRRFAVSPLAPYAIARAREGCSILTAPATARTVFHAPYPQHAQGGCSRVWRACTSTVVYGSIPAAVLDPFTVAESRELVLRQVWHSPTAS